MSANSYYEKLLKVVIDNSEGFSWEESVREWEIHDWEEDEDCLSECICGKKGIRYLYTIHNIKNNNFLVPIGSCCIKKFGRSDLNEEISTLEQMYKLLHAVDNRERIELTPEYFSKKLLYTLYEKNIFEPTQYNNYDGYNDYLFLLEMFKKRNKSEITERQKRKITAIIMNSVLPYLRNTLKKRKNINTKVNEVI